MARKAKKVVKKKYVQSTTKIRTSLVLNDLGEKLDSLGGEIGLLADACVIEENSGIESFQSALDLLNQAKGRPIYKIEMDETEYFFIGELADLKKTFKGAIAEAEEDAIDEDEHVFADIEGDDFEDDYDDSNDWEDEFDEEEEEFDDNGRP